MTRHEQRVVTLTVSVPLDTYRRLQERSEEWATTPAVIASHDIVKRNEPGIRQQAMLTLRARIYDLWRKGLTGPKIARELGIALSTVDKHKKAIRAEWHRWVA